MNGTPPLLVLHDRLWFATFSVVFMTLMSAMAVTNTFDIAPWTTPLLHRYLGAFLAITFVPMNLLMIVKLFSWKPRLDATPDGIRLWSLRGHSLIRWTEIAEIEPAATPIRFGELKGIRIKMEPSAPLHAAFARRSKLRRAVFGDLRDGIVVTMLGTGRKRDDVLTELLRLRALFSPKPASLSHGQS
jgi:hypothetical protein